MEIVINGRFLTQDITGVQRYARELVHALDILLDTRPELKVSVASPRLKNIPVPWRNIVLHQVGRLKGHAWEQFELPWYARGKVLFCPGNTAPVISLYSGQPTIVTVHDLSYQYFPEAYRFSFRLWYRFIIPLVLHRARSVITVSEAERKAIIAHYPHAALRLHAISNGGLPAGMSIDMTHSADRNRGYILYVGSLSKRKNFPRTLEAACRLARKRGFHFVFVGSASGGLTTSVAEVPGDVSSHISLVGAVADPAKLTSYYRLATCLLFPSLYESSGLPPVEAMACGCPVLASSIPALKERCGDAALYCDPHDIESIIEAVEHMMDTPSLRSQLQKLGYQRAATYTWQRCAQQTIDLICKYGQTHVRLDAAT